jgi:hypothetical protein
MAAAMVEFDTSNGRKHTEIVAHRFGGGDCFGRFRVLRCSKWIGSIVPEILTCFGPTCVDAYGI